MKADAENHSGLARRYSQLLVIWSALLGGSLLWSMQQESNRTRGFAEAAARANINKDLAFRRWATSHGGVYVPPTAHTPPNPYLKLPDRDVVTTKGKPLTLMNPAYMLRQLQTDFPGGYGTKSHITSLNLLNPSNAPDAWETDALQAFEQGEKERVEVGQIDGRPYLRMMLPLVAEAGCLKCHGFQGYKVGEIRGGVSTAVALTPFLDHERAHNTRIALSHGAMWLVGLVGLGVLYRRDRRTAADNWSQQLAATMELTREEEKFHTMADFTFDWEYWEGPRHEILYISPSCERVTGYTPAEFVADPGLLKRIVHFDDLHLMEGHVHGIEHEDEEQIDFRILRRDGEIRWIAHACRSVRGRDGEFRGWRVSNRDITERKQAEAALFQLNTDLERRVAQRTNELETAIYDLEKFNYSASHDLRIPLRAVDGFSRILLKEHAQQLDAEGLRLLNVVRGSTKRMAQLIDDMQAFSRTGHIPLAFARIDLEELVREVMEDLKPATAGRDIKLEVESLGSVYADRAMMRQVFLNLLSNAIKFTRTREAAVIQVGCSIEEDEVVCYVKDNGVGFDMKYADKLFGVFQRLHGVDEFEGTGIGLVIVKRIITRLNGRVWAEGKVNEGATIYFSLPHDPQEGGA